MSLGFSDCGLLCFACEFDSVGLVYRFLLWAGCLGCGWVCDLVGGFC